MPDKPKSDADLARRKMLRLSCYVAPVVIGSFITRDAAAGSCDPNTQCNPDVYPCHPDCWPQTH